MVLNENTTLDIIVSSFKYLRRSSIDCRNIKNFVLEFWVSINIPVSTSLLALYNDFFCQ